MRKYFQVICMMKNCVQNEQRNLQQSKKTTQSLKWTKDMNKRFVKKMMNELSEKMFFISH